MPIFEFVCKECEWPFEEILRNSTFVGEVVCPACGSQKVQKKISTFASKVSSGKSFGSISSAGAACSTGST